MDRITYWSCNDEDDNLAYRDRDKAIDNHLSQIVGVLPETIKVYGFALAVILRPSADLVLQNVLDELDCEYAGEDGDDNATIKMAEAAEVFLDAVMADYIPWRHDVVSTETLNVETWCHRCKPTWLAPTAQRRETTLRGALEEIARENSGHSCAAVARAALARVS